jgi:competence protein ComEA
VNWKEIVKDYFTFTQKERIGLLVIIILIIGIWLSPQLISPGKPKYISADTSWMAAAKKLLHREVIPEKNMQQKDENIDELVYDKPLANQYATRSDLFYFDPNTLSSDRWKKLGIREKTIATIQKYLSKGGHFHKAEDLKKIYGIYPEEYAILEPYIKIEPINNNTDQYPKTEFKKNQSFNRPVAVDINAADTAAFISLPGIGNKLALRIVNFRDKLGGFYSIDQIGEVYGLPDSTFQKLKSYLTLKTLTLLKKFNINSATKDEMKSHPYLKWNLANAIVEYRNQHGNFSSLDDLKKISIITDEVFNKIKFYLTLD